MKPQTVLVVSIDDDGVDVRVEANDIPSPVLASALGAGIATAKHAMKQMLDAASSDAARTQLVQAFERGLNDQDVEVTSDHLILQHLDTYPKKPVT